MCPLYISAHLRDKSPNPKSNRTMVRNALYACHGTFVEMKCVNKKSIELMALACFTTLSPWPPSLARLRT